MNLTYQFILLGLGMVLVYFSEWIGSADKWEYVRSLAFIIGLILIIHFSMFIARDLGFSIPLAGLIGAAVSLLLIFMGHDLSGTANDSDPS